MGKIRSTRRLRAWIVEQVNSGKYPGLLWDNESKTMFRIPWKHAGKQDFRTDEDAAIFKAWAEFKGKLSGGVRDDPASWKTRLRCALNKSPEFEEVAERAQLDISEPYKVYRLVPTIEQGAGIYEKKCKDKPSRRLKRRSSESDEDYVPPKHTKQEVETSPLRVDHMLHSEAAGQGESTRQTLSLQREGIVDEFQVNLRIETIPPPSGVHHSFDVAVSYFGQDVLRREVSGTDIRIAYSAPSPVPPTSASLMGGFARINLPEPPPHLTSNPAFKLQLDALSTLLPYMEKGVMLTSSSGGVYARRFCQGRVYWNGPHTSTTEPNKMVRDESVLIFSREIFKQQLDHFRMNGGERPQCGVTLCFGEELIDADDPSTKLIIVQITLPWAEQEVQEAVGIMESISILHTLASQSQNGEITLNLVSVP